MKKTFIVYETIEEMLNELPDEDYIIFSKAVYSYGLHEIEPEFTGIRKALWTQIKFCIDNSKEFRNRQKENGSKGGRPKAMETQENPKIATESHENPNVNVNVNVNENVNTQTEIPEYIKRIENSVCAGSRNNGQLTKDLFNIINAHNSTAPKGRAIAIPKDEWTFSTKNMRELLDAVGTEEPAERILESISNFIKIAKSDTWQKSFTWAMFCKHYNDYTPEFFTLERYLNSEPQTEDATQKPEYKFYMRMKDNPRFSIDLFQSHIEDWKKDGRPEGADYFRLQNEWEAQECL